MQGTYFFTKVRKRIEEVFVLTEDGRSLARTHLIGQARLAGQELLCIATDNLVRLGNLGGWGMPAYLGSNPPRIHRRRGNRLGTGYIGPQPELKKVEPSGAAQNSINKGWVGEIEHGFFNGLLNNLTDNAYQ